MDIVQLFKLLLDFLGNNIWPLILLVFLLIGRKAISSLLERVTKLNFKFGDASGGVEAAAPKIETQEQPGEITAPEVSKPQLPSPEAVEVEKAEKEKDWFGKMTEALDHGQVDKAKDIFESHQRDENDVDERHSNEALFLHFLYVDGKDDTALRRLEELVERSSNDQQLQRSVIWLSWCYTASKDYTKAEALWLRSIAKVRGESERTGFMVRLASLYQEMGEAQKGVDLIIKRLHEATDPQDKSVLYSELANLEKERGNKEIAALALERVIEFDPANRKQLFDAAYLQSEATLSILALANYQTLIGLDQKHAIAFNNLAVTAGEFDLKGKQVAFYKRAIEEGSTLAMANLANHEISAGFWNEAGEILDTARKADNPHENVGNAFYKLKSAQEEEEKKWQSLGKKAQEFKRKVRKYGESYFESECNAKSFDGAWFTDKGTQVFVERNGQKIMSAWTETTSGGLIATAYTYKFSLSGLVTRCSAQMTYHRVGESARVSLLSGSTDEYIECYSYLIDNNNGWLIFSKDSKKDFEMILRRGRNDT